MGETLRSLISSLVQSIDMVNFLLKNHHRRTAVLAAQLGRAYGLEARAQSNLVLAASLHDIGALTISERDQLLHLDVENPMPHARLGAYMLDSFEPFEEISRIIYYHHWPFEQDAYPDREQGAVPLESYFLHVADRVDVLIDPSKHVLLQVDQVKEVINELSGTLFHPAPVQALNEVSKKDSFWLDIDNKSMKEVLDESIAESFSVSINLDLLEQLAFTVSKVIDCRSAFTATHSFGVSEVAYELGRLAGYSEEKCRKMRIAGLLHDIGKVGIDTTLLEKNGPLTDDERRHVNAHAYFTNVILHDTDGIKDIAEWASHHHENQDGSGYPDRYDQNKITEEMDILAYADIFTALAEDRPYREGLTDEQILFIMEKEFKGKHGSRIFNIMRDHFSQIRGVCMSAISDGTTRYNIHKSLVCKFEQIK